MENLNFLDYGILFVMVASVGVGLLRGFVKEALSVAAWTISVWAAISYGDDVLASIESISDSRNLLLMLSYGGVFFGSLLLTGLLNLLLAGIINITGFFFMDKALGVIFGLLRGILFIGIAGVIMHLLSMQESDWWKESVYIEYFTPTIDWLQSYIPDQEILKGKLTVSEFSEQQLNKLKLF